MAVPARSLLGRFARAALLLVSLVSVAAEPTRHGPAAEKRFPPLKLPAGFRATLFACDPVIEYPSAIAAGPRPGSLFVAIDYMTGLGTEIVRRDEIRLLEDTDGDGYADRVSVYARGFNSIQGLAYHDGTVFVMHAPFLTALRDTDGDGKADDRRDLLTGLGPTPEENPVRLHAANGVVYGHDGWLYLALGDHGCDVRRPEGDRLVLHEGAILRCRPDGRDLHVFAHGLRNIYDIALDADLNVFVRDNENDGGTYMVRVCHSFFGADHGYPYLYEERPDEALPPLADLGLGSSAGGLCYLERQFPAAYRGSLFFCEWGRSVVCYHPRPQGSGFAPLKEQEFAAGAERDPYGFKPTDLVVDHDGALFVADWADDQRPRRGRGRIYRITAAGVRPEKGTGPLRRGGLSPFPAGLEEAIAWLGFESSRDRIEAQEAIERRGREGTHAIRLAWGRRQLDARARLHALWTLAHVDGPAGTGELFDWARSDPDPRVQVQAIRALADLVDPVLVRHRLDAGPGDADLARRLAGWAEGKDPRVLREAIVTLGRLRWRDAPGWLARVLSRPDAPLAHAAQQTLRRSDNWQAVLELIDRPDAEPIRAIALRALSGQFVPELVDGLCARLRKESDPVRRRQYADALTRVYRRPGPYVYWGYRPPPRPANTIPWECTDRVGQALDRALADPDRTVRLAVLRRMQREKVPARLDTLGRWLREEQDAERLTAVLDSLRDQPSGATRALLEAAIVDRKKPSAGRLTALALLAGGLDEAHADRLLALAGSLEEGPVLAEALRQLGRRPRLDGSRLLLNRLGSPHPAVRAAAVAALAERGVTAAAGPVQALLLDKDAAVRRAAADAVGKLGVRSAATALLRLTRDPDPGVRRRSLESLRLLGEPRAVPPAVAALADPETRQAALACLAAVGGPDQAGAVLDLARREPSAEVLPRVLRLLTDWADRPGSRRVELEAAVADLQGTSGVLARWRTAGPLPADSAARLAERLSAAKRLPPDGPEPRWQTVFAAGAEARVSLGPATHGVGRAWLASTDLRVPERGPVQFLAAASGTLRVWVNGHPVYRRDAVQPYRPDSDRFDGVLERGTNRVVVWLAEAKGGVAFQLRFRRRGSTLEHEQLTEAALTRQGDVTRGRKVFLDVARSQCLKCHRVGNQGERIGPELTGVGSRFPRIYLIESILQPSRTIATGYQTLVVTLRDGRVLTGVRTAETETTLTLGDDQGKQHVLQKVDIEEQVPQATSTMPEGLEKGLTRDEFVDLIAFLASLKAERPR